MDRQPFYSRTKSRTLINCLLKVWAGANKVNEILAVLFVVAISVFVFMGICARYIFRAPFEWTDEFAIYGFIWLCFLGAGLAEKNNHHFRVTVLVEKMGPKARLITEIFLHIILFHIMYRFFQDSMKYYNQGKSGISTIMQVPLSYIYMSLPVCVSMLFLNRIKIFIDSVILYVRMIKDPNYTPPAEAQ